MALALPMARVRRCEPPMPGSTPSLISGWPNFAVSAAISTSHIMASSQPPPSACPATAAIVGVRTSASLPQGAKKSAPKASANVSPAISLMSAPAANALAEPVMMIAPMPGSSSKSAAALVTSFITWVFSALRAFGRFSVMMPTRSSRSTRMVSYCVSVIWAAFLETQVVVDRGEIRLDIGRRDGGQLRRRPLGIAILVDQLRANSLDQVV